MKKAKCLLLGYLSLLAFSKELVNKDVIQVFPSYSVGNLVLFLGLVLLYRFMFEIIEQRGNRTKRDCVYAGVLGVLLTVSMLIGEAIDSTGSSLGLITDRLQMLKACVKFIGYVPLFTMGALSLLYMGSGVNLANCEREHRPVEKAWAFFEQRPFLCSLVLICVMYLPYLLLSYPAILQGDGKQMIPQGFNLPEYQSGKLVLLDENVTLNGHHPLVYTLLLHGGLLLGKALFHSYNVGLFMVALVQFLYAALAIAYLIHCMVRMKTDARLCFAVLLYYIFSPRVASYMALISKDVIYSYSMLLLVIQITRCVHNRYISYELQRGGVFCGKEQGLMDASVVLLSLVLALFRNEGRYIILFWMLFLIIRFKKTRKLMATSIFATIVTVFLLNNVIMPLCKITPGSIREMMSIPFQQTARYVKVCPEDVTEEERAAIDKLLQYDTLAERYDMKKSDAVKEPYNKYASREDWARYIAAWFQMFKRHPFVYVDATLCNYYYYFYPSEHLSNYTYEWSKTCMDKTNQLCESVGMDLHYPQRLDNLRTIYEKGREKILQQPIIRFLGSTATYVWGLLFFVCFLLWKKDIDTFLISAIPLLGSLGITLLGPCNGDYFRYTYIFTVVLPFVAVLSLHNKNPEKATS